MRPRKADNWMREIPQMLGFRRTAPKAATTGWIGQGFHSIQRDLRVARRHGNPTAIRAPACFGGGVLFGSRNSNAGHFLPRDGSIQACLLGRGGSAVDDQVHARTELTGFQATQQFTRLDRSKALFLGGVVGQHGDEK